MKQQPLEMFDVEQGTPEWLELRRGIPTTSKFAPILTNEDGAETYLYQLASERMTGELAPQKVTPAMERGKIMEPEIRAYYETFKAKGPTRQIGFCKRGPVGCSPDLLIGEDGIAEFKSAEPHILFLDIQGKKLPTRFKAQCQGGLWITGRQYCDLVVYWHRKMPKLEIRVERDEAYIEKLANAVLAFELRLRRFVKEWQDK